MVSPTPSEAMSSARDVHALRREGNPSVRPRQRLETVQHQRVVVELRMLQPAGITSGFAGFFPGTTGGSSASMHVLLGLHHHGLQPQQVGELGGGVGVLAPQPARRATGTCRRSTTCTGAACTRGRRRRCSCSGSSPRPPAAGCRRAGRARRWRRPSRSASVSGSPTIRVLPWYSAPKCCFIEATSCCGCQSVTFWLAGNAHGLEAQHHHRPADQQPGQRTPGAQPPDHQPGQRADQHGRGDDRVRPAGLRRPRQVAADHDDPGRWPRRGAGAGRCAATR